MLRYGLVVSHQFELSGIFCLFKTKFIVETAVCWSHSNITQVDRQLKSILPDFW